MITCKGSEVQTGVLNPGHTWTTPGGNILIRGVVQTYSETSADAGCAMLTGVNTTVFNANLNSYFVGPIWGTFQLTGSEHGGMQGVWTGKSMANGFEYTAVGNGIGDYRGYKIWLHCVNGIWEAQVLAP